MRVSLAMCFIVMTGLACCFACLRVCGVGRSLLFLIASAQVLTAFLFVRSALIELGKSNFGTAIASAAIAAMISFGAFLLVVICLRPVLP